MPLRFSQILIFRCIKHNGKGPWWCLPIGNPCKCDTPFVWKAYWNIYSCPPPSCKWNAYQVFIAFFGKLSCWFPTRLCFPWIRFVYRRFWCSITIYWKCITFKMCAFFGSGRVSFQYTILWVENFSMGVAQLFYHHCILYAYFSSCCCYCCYCYCYCCMKPFIYLYACLSSHAEYTWYLKVTFFKTIN